MHSRWALIVLLGLALAHAPAAAEDAAALRRELDEMKSRFETMRATYQKAIDHLDSASDTSTRTGATSASR